MIEENKTGWICPRCRKVNAPWKSSCDCSGNEYYWPVPYHPILPSYPQPVWIEPPIITYYNYTSDNTNIEK